MTKPLIKLVADRAGYWEYQHIETGKRFRINLFRPVTGPSRARGFTRRHSHLIGGATPTTYKLVRWPSGELWDSQKKPQFIESFLSRDSAEKRLRQIATAERTREDVESETSAESEHEHSATRSNDLFSNH